MAVSWEAEAKQAAAELQKLQRRLLKECTGIRAAVQTAADLVDGPAGAPQAPVAHIIRHMEQVEHSISAFRKAEKAEMVAQGDKNTLR